MLSILIPVYNYDATTLVKEIHRQAIANNITFEIRLYDDGSTIEVEKNKTITDWEYCIYKAIPKNIGRSAIRNLLASEATYNHLLFIDSGTFPKSADFIKNYIDNLNHKVCTGGMVCLPQKPKKPYVLRWLYTKKREMAFDTQINKNVVCSSNFLIQKDVFSSIKFDESLKKYGCEDVIFFDAIDKKGITIHQIDNSVIHDATDDARTFIRKTEDALENLSFLIKEGKISESRYKVTSMYASLNKFKLDKFVGLLFSGVKSLLMLNFRSSYPSIIAYDFYRLGYYCRLKNKK